MSRDKHLKLALVHAHPLERYPPATNTIDYFAAQPHTQLLAVSVDTPENTKPYQNANCLIHRIALRKPNDSVFNKATRSMFWHWKVARKVASWKPDILLYWDPQSALACYLSMRWYGCNPALFIHHHEYHAPEDFLRIGMRITRIGHYFEKKWLFPRAKWFSQTNQKRMQLFRSDVPCLTDEQAHILPNYPPQSWLARCRSDRNNEQKDALRLVYVGSLSLTDTFIGPLVEWLLTNSGSRLTLDIFTNNCEQRTLEFLRRADGDVVRLHERGIEYQHIPEMLTNFDVGVVLYRCNSTNYVYNASNKLFEYLTCGLDVWFPPTMLGVKPYARNDVSPRVIEVDFERMQELDLNLLRTRDGLSHAPWVETCESQLAVLETEMRKAMAD